MDGVQGDVDGRTSTRILRRAASRLGALVAFFALQPVIAGGPEISEVMVDPPGRVARLSYLEGRVSLAADGTAEWVDAVLNRPLTSGDRLALL